MDDKVQSGITTQQVGMGMLRMKARSIRKELGGVFEKPTGQATMALQLLVCRNHKLSRWMRVASVDIFQLERIVRHEK